MTPTTKTPVRWDAQAMLELGTRHARLEAEGKLDDPAGLQQQLPSGMTSPLGSAGL